MWHICVIFHTFLGMRYNKEFKEKLCVGCRVETWSISDIETAPRECCSYKASRRFQSAIRFALFYSLTLKRSCRVPVYVDDAADVPGSDSFRSIAQDLSHFASRTNLLIAPFLSFTRHGHFTLVSSRIERSTSPVLLIPLAKDSLVLCCNRRPLNQNSFSSI